MEEKETKEKTADIGFETFCIIAEKLLMIPANIVSLRETLVQNTDILMPTKMKTTFKNADLLLVYIFAYISEVVDPSDIRLFLVKNFDFFIQYTRLTRIPSSETFKTLLNSVDWNQFCVIMQDWTTKAFRSSTNKAQDDNSPFKSLHASLRDEVRDPREKNGQLYKVFADLLIVIIVSAFCGKTSAVRISEYCRTNFDFFKEITSLKTVPSHDTFNRAYQKADSVELAKCLTKWTDSNFDPPQIKAFRDMNHLCMDGKAIRGAAAKSNGECPRYIINAMYYGDTHSLGMIDIAGKGNEQSRMDEAIDLFPYGGTLFSADSAGTNQKTIFKVLKKGWHFFLPLKENQETLYNHVWNNTIQLKLSMMEKEKEYREIKEKFIEIDTEINGFPTYIVRRKQHGRIEIYVCCIISGDNLSEYYGWVNGLEDKSFFDKINAIAVVQKSSRKTGKAHENDKPETSTRFYITDIGDMKPNEVIMLRSQHWSVEAGHYLLDVFMDEDKHTARKDNSMLNGAIMRRFVFRIKKRCIKTANMSAGEFFSYTTKVDNIADCLLIKRA